MSQQNHIKKQIKQSIPDGLQKRQSSIDTLRFANEDSPANNNGSINYGFGSQQTLDFSIQQVYSRAQQRKTVESLSKNIERMKGYKSPPVDLDSSKNGSSHRGFQANPHQKKMTTSLPSYTKSEDLDPNRKTQKRLRQRTMSIDFKQDMKGYQKMLKLLIDKKSNVNKQLSEIKGESEQANQSVGNTPKSTITDSAAKLQFNMDLNQPSLPSHQSFSTRSRRLSNTKKQIYNTAEIKLLPHTIFLDSSQSKDMPINIGKTRKDFEKVSNSYNKQLNEKRMIRNEEDYDSIQQIQDITISSSPSNQGENEALVFQENQGLLQSCESEDNANIVAKMGEVSMGQLSIDKVNATHKGPMLQKIVFSSQSVQNSDYHLSNQKYIIDPQIRKHTGDKDYVQQYDSELSNTNSKTTKMKQNNEIYTENQSYKISRQLDTTEWTSFTNTQQQELDIQLEQNYRTRIKNIQRFKKENPIHKNLTHRQIIVIFKCYYQYVRRSYGTENISFLVAGTLIILICSLFVNAGAPLKLDEKIQDPNKVVMNTVISSATAGLFTALTYNYNNNLQDMQRRRTKNDDGGSMQNLYYFDIKHLCNAVLAGLVSVTSSSSNIELWAACLIGLIGSMIYTSTKKLIVRAEIDDPLDISEVHGFCGIWSIIALGIFDMDKGVIYTGSLNQLFIQMIGAISYVLWSTFLSFIFFYSLKQVDRLRVAFLFEVIGLDMMKYQREGKSNILDQALQEEEKKYALRSLQQRRINKY